MDLRVCVEIAGVAVALITVLGALYTTAMTLYRNIVQPIRQSVENQGELVVKVDWIKKELSPNGGTTLKDKVNELSSTCERIESRQIILDQRSKAIFHNYDGPVFETDELGHLVWANAAFYKRMEEHGFRHEISGLDWICYIDEKDREQFLKELVSCLETARELKVETFSMSNEKVLFIGYPYRTNDTYHAGFLIYLK